MISSTSLFLLLTTALLGTRGFSPASHLVDKRGFSTWNANHGSKSPHGILPTSSIDDTNNGMHRAILGSMFVYCFAELRQLCYCGDAQTNFSEVQGRVSVPKLVRIFRDELSYLAKKSCNGNGTLVSDYYWLVDAVDCAQELLRTIDSEEQTAINQCVVVPCNSETTRFDEAITALKRLCLAFFFIAEKDLDPHEQSLLDVMYSFYVHFLKDTSFLRAVKEENVGLALFRDRYPGRECVYCITTNPVKKKVTVIFRGTANLNEWQYNLEFGQTEVENPVDTPDTKIGIHSGFYSFLLRQHEGKMAERQFDLIMKEVARAIREATDTQEDEANWSIAVAGHSLGGALATLFGFFAAAERGRLQLDFGLSVAKPVEVFTFASPLVGDSRFKNAATELIDGKQLVHQRVEHANDFIPTVPYFAVDSERGLAWYRHVGQRITLSELGRGASDHGFGLFLPPPFFRVPENHDVATYKFLLDTTTPRETENELEFWVITRYLALTHVFFFVNLSIVRTLVFVVMRPLFSDPDDLLYQVGGLFEHNIKLFIRESNVELFTTPLEWAGKRDLISFLTDAFQVAGEVVFGFLCLVVFARIIFVLVDPEGFIDRTLRQNAFERTLFPPREPSKKH